MMIPDSDIGGCKPNEGDRALLVVREGLKETVTERLGNSKP